MDHRWRYLIVAVAAVLVLGLAAPLPASGATVNLHRGSRGEKVRVLESRLHQLRLLRASAVDRRYRLDTVRAVRRYQRSHKLRVTGRTNQRTWNSVARAVARRTAPKPTAPAPAPPPPAAPPMILGHRGAVTAAVAENTLASMRSAVGSADVLEFDLRLTADRELVLMHDATLDRTTTCSGPVAARTLAELRSSCPTDQGEPIPSFGEAAELAQDASVAIAPELKTESLSDQDLAGFIDVITASGLTGQTFVQSFYGEHLRRLRTLAPGLTLVYVSSAWTTPQTVTSTGATIAALNIAVLTASRVADFQRAGVGVWAWTARTAADLVAVREMRANGVVTDIPAQAEEIYHPGR